MSTSVSTSVSTSITLNLNADVLALASKKTGKISKSAQKAAELVQSASPSARIAMALTPGALQATAANSIKGQVITLDMMLSADKVNNWGDLFTLLVNKFGATNANRDKASFNYMAGQSGVHKYLTLCMASCLVDEGRAESDKAREKVAANKSELEVAMAAVNRLMAAHAAARAQAEQLALEAAGLSAELTTAGLSAELPTVPAVEALIVDEVLHDSHVETMLNS